MQLLPERGAGLNEVDNNGHTAMHAAAEGNFPAIVQLLADRGADANVWKRPDVEGRTPLFIAEGIRRGRPQLNHPTIDAIQRLMVTKAFRRTGPGRVYRYLREGTRAYRNGQTLGHGWDHHRI